MERQLQYKKYGESAVLIEYPSVINEKILRDLLLYKKNIEEYYGELIVEVISSYNSLLVCYVSGIEEFYSSVLELKSICFSDSGCQKFKNRLWEIPVCYSPSLAPDLEQFTFQKSIKISEVIALHTAPIYMVYFIGFLPGFLYLGGLNEKLVIPRKMTPSLHVEKGSVAIGGNQTGVYSLDSPGGWYVIGKSPVNFFDISLEKPCFAKPGDCIQFISISENKYNDIRSEINNDCFVLNNRLL